MEKDIAINEYMCDKLVLLKQENPDLYIKVYGLLSFIYKDVDKDYYARLKDKYEIEDRIKKAGDPDYRDNRAYYLERERDELFSTFVGKESGIVDMLFTLALSKDKNFQDKFFESVALPISMYRDGVVFDSQPALYIYNLYTMLYAYIANKDNYENFETIIDDVKHNLISETNYYGSKETYYQDKKNMIKQFLELPNYHKNSSVRELFKKLISRIKYRLEDEEKYKYKEMLNGFINLYNGIEEAKQAGITIDEETIKEIEQDLTGIASNTSQVEVYFEKVLLFNNRYQFIKERLPKLDETPKTRRQITEKLAYLDNSFFEYLNSLNIYDGDSFTEVMKIVFDSDSFHTLFSRIDSLVQASTSYKRDDNERSLQLVKELTSQKHDGYYDGVAIVLPQNNINITKPNSIAERMVLFYQMNFGLGKRPSCLTEYQNENYSDYNDFVEALEQQVEEERRERQFSSPSPISALEKEPKAKKGFFSRF